MSQTVVVVTFYSRCGETERLATAAAVGAVQSRAGIRMRRLVEADAERARMQRPECREHIDRMRREYVPPKEADLLAADALVVGTPPDLDATSPEWAPFMAMLEQLRGSGTLEGKSVAVVGAGASRERMAASLAAVGLTVVSGAAPGTSVDAAVTLGRDVVAAARERAAVR